MKMMNEELKMKECSEAAFIISNKTGEAVSGIFHYSFLIFH
jgi:hypothetical protein